MRSAPFRLVISRMVDNTAAETIRYLATELQEARRKLKTNGRPVPDNWQDYVLGQTKRALAVEDSGKLHALIVEAMASIGPRDAVSVATGPCCCR